MSHLPAGQIQARFLDPLSVTRRPGGRWALTRPLRYQSAVLRALLTVHAGFLTDFASVPRLPFAFWLFGDTAHAEAVVHDFLCATKIVPRAQADRVFLEAMEVSGIPAWRRWPMYLAVRLFGGRCWECRAPVAAHPGALVASSMGPEP